MQPQDMTQLRYMLEAAQAALVFTERKDEQQLFEDKRLVLAVAKALDLIGDSAAKVSVETRIDNRQINWTYLLGLPKWVYENGGDVNRKVVWDAVTNEIPMLIARLQHIRMKLETRA